MVSSKPIVHEKAPETLQTVFSNASHVKALNCEWSLIEMCLQGCDLYWMCIAHGTESFQTDGNHLPKIDNKWTSQTLPDICLKRQKVIFRAMYILYFNQVANNFSNNFIYDILV